VNPACLASSCQSPYSRVPYGRMGRDWDAAAGAVGAVQVAAWEVVSKSVLPGCAVLGPEMSGVSLEECCVGVPATLEEFRGGMGQYVPGTAPSF